MQGDGALCCPALEVSTIQVVLWTTARAREASETSCCDIITHLGTLSAPVPTRETALVSLGKQCAPLDGIEV